MIAENLISYKFRECVAKPINEVATYQLYENGFRIAVVIFRQFLCSLRLIDEHNGFFAFIGTVAVAIFTYTLWRSTERLWESAEREQRRSDLVSSRQGAQMVSQLQIASSSAQSAAATARIMDETAKRQLRAYINVESNKSIQRDAYITFIVKIKNFGVTQRMPRD